MGEGVKVPPDHFFAVISYPLGVKGNASVTFPKYDRATRWWKQNESSIHQMANMVAQNRK